MFPKELSFFYLQILNESLQSITAIVAFILLIAAVFASKIFAGYGDRAHLAVRALLTICSLALLIFNFYATVLDVPENLELLEVAKEYPDDADCGTAMTGFYTAGIGLLNPCGKGCYRGITVRRQLRLRGFPPMPEYNREMQCWARKNPQKAIIPEKYQALIR